MSQGQKSIFRLIGDFYGGIIFSIFRHNQYCHVGDQFPQLKQQSGAQIRIKDFRESLLYGLKNYLGQEWINMVKNNFSRIVGLEFMRSRIGHKSKLILANSWGIKEYK